MDNSLERFIKAQENSYQNALYEVKSGQKKGHWMWYIFPQYKNLGRSETSIYYAIKDTAEASAYLNHPILGTRLKDICSELLKLESSDPLKIFGAIDSLKLKSSMTLFNYVNQEENCMFLEVLKKFFGGEKDQQTIQLLNESKEN
ncbi:MAG TPA: DUF1810 domain-containing protein [Candidatus Cloacimonadota bacterium]|mgnify:CR=1 FL=1|nr:DUF1810 domain-containing protein [Candidatus Cloacimonadota bacterium]HPM01576.1 DUF1810 domain-containing protein [Candidatus Cloacimonadota bacterium]